MKLATDIVEGIGHFHMANLPAGTAVFRDGDACENFYLVKSGSIRVDLINSFGKSILLYRIGPEETCILTTSCLICDENYSAEAVTESKVTVVVIPKAEFQRYLNESSLFRALVFRSFSQRLAAMMARIDEISFSSLGSRIAHRLLELATDCNQIAITHEQLAHDIGSAREVISRKLVEMENEGLLERGRGKVTIRSRAGLQKLLHEGD